jgi:hypothetical protein
MCDDGSNCNQKPEALRLADALSVALQQSDTEDNVIHVARWFVEDSAAELRRLYAVNKRLEDVTQELLGALRKSVETTYSDTLFAEWNALIAKAEGQA